MNRIRRIFQSKKPTKLTSLPSSNFYSFFPLFISPQRSHPSALGYQWSAMRSTRWPRVSLFYVAVPTASVPICQDVFHNSFIFNKNRPQNGARSKQPLMLRIPNSPCRDGTFTHLLRCAAYMPSELYCPRSNYNTRNEARIMQILVLGRNLSFNQEFCFLRSV